MNRQEAIRLVSEFPALRKLGEHLRTKSIPVVHQTTATDCGAACLSMVLAHHGRHVALDEVRKSLAVGRDGVTARAIVECASFYGLRGRGVRIDVTDLPRLPRASILHWNFSHFIILERADARSVHVIDPAEGRCPIPIADAGKLFTGIALVFEKTEAFTPNRPGENPVVRHLKQAIAGSEDWHRIAFTSILMQLLALIAPVLNGRLIDRVVPRQDMHLFGVLGAALVVTLTFEFITQITRGQLLLQLRTTFDTRMTFGFIERLLRLPYDFFERRHAGDLQMRLASVSSIREALTGAVLTGVIDGVMVIGHLLFLILTSAKMTIVSLVVVAVQVGVYLATRRKLEELAAGSVAKQSEAANALNELLVGMESLKASGCEQKASQPWAARYVDVMNIGLRQGQMTNFSSAILGTLHMLGPIVILMVGALEVMDRKMSLGTLLAAETLAAGFLQPVMSLVSTLQSLQMTRMHLARIDDVINTSPEQGASDHLTVAPKLRGQIVLDHVSFRYGPQLPLAVQSVSVHIQPGESVAIVGRSGSGKTTLGRLLLGLYQPSEGAIALDGIPLSQLDLRSVRRQLGVVVQKPHVIGTTIRGNIALADPDIPLPRVHQAAKRACIHDDIMKMPMQYDTPIVADGGSLSGGQRQRIALARALVNEPAIVLLDEATSALDAITEAHVRRELECLRCTRVVIAHRLSTVIGADRILVMQDGVLIEQGRHNELLAQGGIYASLVAAQMADDTGAAVLRADTPNASVDAPGDARRAPADAPPGASQRHLGNPRASGSQLMRSSSLVLGDDPTVLAGGSARQLVKSSPSVHGDDPTVAAIPDAGLLAKSVQSNDGIGNGTSAQRGLTSPCPRKPSPQRKTSPAVEARSPLMDGVSAAGADRTAGADTEAAEDATWRWSRGGEP